MRVQILGTGCPKCRQLTENARKAIVDAGLDAEIEKVTDLKTIAKMGVMTTPALAVDGKVKSSGKVPSPEEIRAMLR